MPQSTADDQLAWRYERIDLRTPDGWSRLRRGLFGPRHFSQPVGRISAAHTIIDQLRSLNVQSAIAEFPYHDDDFSDEYVAFYAGTFRPGLKACTRYHFFTVPDEDIGVLLSRSYGEPERTRLRRLISYGDRAPVVFDGEHPIYVGFCVVRPTRDAPIGRTVIATRNLQSPITRGLRSRHDAHLLGARFSVRGFAFIEQDARTASCAQAALWMSLRHIHAADGGPWLSLPDLTSQAAEILNETSARSIPAGSSGLNISNMLAVIRSAGRLPHYLPAITTFRGGRPVMNWLQDPMIDVSSYIDSGIPVILLVNDSRSSQRRSVGRKTRVQATHRQTDELLVSDAHALTAVGYYGGRTFKRPTKAGNQAHVSAWLEGLVVHDDQVGPNLKLLRRRTGKAKEGESEYTVQDVFGMIIPRPEKVYLAPDTAQQLAWTFLRTHASEWWRSHVRSALGRRQTRSQPSALDPGRLAARTFLMYGYDHYVWLTQKGAHPHVSKLAAHVHCPRHIWVTEFYEMAPDGNLDLNEVVAHVVSDATSANISQSRTIVNDAFLFGHVPGVAFGLVTRGPGEGRLAGADVSGDKKYGSWRPMLAHSTMLME